MQLSSLLIFYETKKYGIEKLLKLEILNADSHTANAERWLSHVLGLVCVRFLGRPPPEHCRDALRTLAGFAVGHEAVSCGTDTLEAAQAVPALVLTRVSALTLIDVCREKHQHLSTP